MRFVNYSFNPAKPITLDDFLTDNDQIKIIKHNQSIKKLFVHVKRFEGYFVMPQRMLQE